MSLKPINNLHINFFIAKLAEMFCFLCSKILLCVTKKKNKVVLSSRTKHVNLQLIFQKRLCIVRTELYPD